MLSRKLVGCVAVGVLSVALVPVTWARTHARPLCKTQTPSKQVQTHTATAKPVTLTAPKTVSHVAIRKSAIRKPVSHKLVSHKLVSHKISSHQLVSHRTSHSTLASKKLVSSKTVSKLTTKRPVSSKLVKKTFAN
jgi:hypothetical protein